MKPLLRCLPLCVALALAACSSPRPSSAPALTASGGPSSLNLRQMLVPRGQHGRRKEFPMRAQYLTIHSTGNRGADALQHARGMARGNFRGRSKWNRTGYLTWHFTVDDRVAIQSLPLHIQGEHADHGGPGNRTSVAIEICEFRNRRQQAAAIDRAARLAAWLSGQLGIPVQNIVPHHHWPQRHFHNHQKNCPRILLEGGRPGPRWAAFLRRVESYR